MTNRCQFRSKVMPAIALLCAAPLANLVARDAPTDAPVANGQTGMEETLDSLGKAASNFVEAFNERNAAAIAALFTPHGKIVGSDGETLEGRQAIENHHRGLFASERVPRIALEVSGVQLMAPGVAIEDGLVHLTLADDEPVRSIGYTATHVKQADGTWLMAVSRSLSDLTKSSEWIKPLHWMIGEWTLEGGDDYVKLLRKLEEHHKANPDSAAANFLLGYHYLVLGHLEQALELFEHSAKLEPTDTVSAGLRDLIRDSINAEEEAENAPPPAPVDPDKLVGTWTSEVAEDGTITLVMTEEGDFSWSFDKTGNSGKLTGEFGIYDSNLLVLIAEDSQMVGEVTFAEDSKLSFVLAGGPRGDPGLTFERQP